MTGPFTCTAIPRVGHTSPGARDRSDVSGQGRHRGKSARVICGANSPTGISAIDLPQHPNEHGPEDSILLAVDQKLGEVAALWVAPVLADAVGSPAAVAARSSLPVRDV
jgi:hypothetical protein